MQLAKGVRAFDVSTGEVFALHAYLMLVFGDIPAVSLASRMTGHNGVRPCRLCNINGVQEPDGRTYYVPLDRSRHPDVLADPSRVKRYDPLNLPLRTEDEFKRQADEVQFASTETRSKELATKYGIKGRSIFFNLSSIIFPLSFPYDFMHLIYENVMKNLALLWTGQFKGMDMGTGECEFKEKVWEEIGAATARCGPHIPSAFSANPPNVADDKQATTADSWSFWMLHLAPVLLENRFPRPIYYKHFIDLVDIVELCLQYEISREDIRKIRTGCKDWVLEYERSVQLSKRVLIIFIGFTIKTIRIVRACAR
ncbi:hypothetical protein BDZ89DRAFT_967483 [Hymenopellis radicata]|nr:hypothetical protein BDZ89DRAFT_967483 [Hymenopellis radicata]